MKESNEVLSISNQHKEEKLSIPKANILSPPDSITFIENNICRCFTPISSTNTAFFFMRQSLQASEEESTTTSASFAASPPVQSSSSSSSTSSSLSSVSTTANENLLLLSSSTSSSSASVKGHDRPVLNIINMYNLPSDINNTSDLLSITASNSLMTTLHDSSLKLSSSSLSLNHTSETFPTSSSSSSSSASSSSSSSSSSSLSSSSNAATLLHSTSSINNISTVINVSGDALDAEFESSAEEVGVKIFNHFFDGVDVASLEVWIKMILELLLSLCSNSTVLIVGNDSTCYDCLIVACLRKIQSWAFVPILAEFYQSIGPQRRIYDMEQFIELFDPNLVEIPSPLPDFLSTHYLLLEEEEKLLERIEARSIVLKKKMIMMDEKKNKGDDDDYDDDEFNIFNDERNKKQCEIDDILYRLFYPKRQIIISPGVQYDPLISLINDKEDDD